MNQFKHKKIEFGGKCIEAVAIKLLSKNLILLIGNKGYVMCGYLNLKVAEKFKDAAVKVVGVKTINDVLRAKVNSCTSAARKLGIFKNQPISEVLRIIA